MPSRAIVRPLVALAAAAVVLPVSARAQAIPPEWRVTVVGPAVLAIGPSAAPQPGGDRRTTAPYLLRLIADPSHTARGTISTSCPAAANTRTRTREFVAANGQVVAPSSVPPDVRRLVELVERSLTPDRVACGQSLDAVHARHLLADERVRALRTLEGVVAELRATRFDHGVLDRIDLRRALGCAAIHADYPQIVKRAGDRELLPKFIFAVEGTGPGTPAALITEELRTESGITSAIGIPEWEVLRQPEEVRKLVQRCTRAIDLELIASRY